MRYERDRTKARRLLSAFLCLAACGVAVATQEPTPAELPPGDLPPPTALTRLEAAGDAEKFPGFDHVVVHEETVNRVDEQGVARTDGYVLYKMLTEKGCRNQSVLRWGFDPRSSWVEVKEANIIRDGERIAVPVDTVLELPAPQAAIYWSDRVKLLQLPRLRVGDGVEVRTFRKGFTYALLHEGEGGGAEPDDERFVPPMPGEYFDIVLFQSEVPALEKRYELHLPPGKRLHSRVYNGALYSSTSYTDESNVYAWWGLDLPAAPHEPRQPSGSDFITKVVMATVESWEAKSRWFFEVNDKQFASTPEIDRKVREILDDAGVKDDDVERKAEVLLHWVAQNIRYSGQTMGQGEGFTLHSGEMIFEQRSGVCKDIAGMLITMMRAAEIPAYAAMTMAGSRIEEVPADQFNHCVVARDTGDGFTMYDPTWVPYNNDIWSKFETEQHYLVGSPGGEGLDRIAYSPPAESPLRVLHEARLLADGTLEGTLRLEGSGGLDSRLRRIVSRVSRRRLDANIAHMLGSFCSRVEGLQVTHRVADDFSGDMWIEVRYRAPGYALPVDGGLEFSGPAMRMLVSEGGLFSAGAETWEEERASDVFLYNTQLVDAVETIRLPRGFDVTVVPQSDVVDETYAFFKGSGESDGGKLVIRSHAEVRRRQIPPEGYAGFTAAMREAHEWADALFRVEKKEEQR